MDHIIHMVGSFTESHFSDPSTSFETSLQFHKAHKFKSEVLLVSNFRTDEERKQKKRSKKWGQGEHPLCLF